MKDKSHTCREQNPDFPVVQPVDCFPNCLTQAREVLSLRSMQSQLQNDVFNSVTVDVNDKEKYCQEKKIGSVVAYLIL